MPPRRGPRGDGPRRARLAVDDRDVAAVELAEDARARSKGLLGRDGIDGALLLRPAMQVHTVRMRFPIDVAFCDRDLVVLRTATMRPWRCSRFVLRARSVVEAEAGQFARWGLRAGSRLAIVESGDQAVSPGFVW